MNTLETIANFATTFESNGDGYETADDIATGFFNSPAQINMDGDIWLCDRNCWASDDRLGDFAEWLELRGIVDENRKILRRRDEIRETANS